MSKIIEAQDLPEEDKVYLKKDRWGWRTVQPIKVDGKIVWINILFGGWRNFWGLISILAVISFLMWSHYHDIDAIQQNYEVIASNPIGWCEDVCKGDIRLPDGSREINISLITP